MKNRERNKLLYQVLKVCEKKQQHKTKIMYEAYLSTGQLNYYMDIALNTGLLDFDIIHRTYKITNKGLEFMRLHDSIDEMLKFGRESYEIPRLPDEIQRRKKLKPGFDEVERIEEEMEHLR